MSYLYSKKLWPLTIAIAVAILALGVYFSTSTTYVKAEAVKGLKIKSVEVTTRGDVQALYRDAVYKGDAANGEDPLKYYTKYREINLKDPRIFNMEFDVTAAELGTKTPEEYLASLSLNYGGFPIGDWGNGNNLRGTTDILFLNSKTITDNLDETYTIKIAFRTGHAWSTTNSGTNIPYAGSVAGTQGNFGSGQTADNRAWWQAGPAYKGCGKYALEAVISGESVASANMHIGPYDEMYSWIEMNEYSQSLIKAITGSEISIADLNKRPIGTMAKGYVALDSKGNFIPGNRATDVYVEVAIIGYGLTDNSKPGNTTFNNYSRFNAQWNVVVAQDESKVDKYLNDTVPTMNNDPQKLIDKYKDEAPEDIDMLNVFYQNNTHADEVTGTESGMKLIKDLIDGKKNGKIIKYKTISTGKNDDSANLDLRYRYSTTGTTTTANSSHRVKGGNTGSVGTGNATFMSTTSRRDTTFNTKEALDQLIFVTTLCSNPDGKAGMRRVNRYALDMNRDVVFSTQPETISLTKDIAKWDPMVLNEWHGYVANMLIEPCTAPHAPTFEYDLLQNNMIELAMESGRAILGSTGMTEFHIPWDHSYGGNWDDGGTIYAPMFAMLFGTYGYTVEFPFSNSDSFDAGNVLNYAMINSLVKGNTAYYPGNGLNGKLPEFDVNGTVLRDDHSGDNKYTSMRKSSVMNKLETKLRGVENIDSMAADKYFIDQVGGASGKYKVVGRARLDDPENPGMKLNFFPDYIVIPTDNNQYNVAEGIKGVNHMISLGAKVSVSTEDIDYNGKTIKAGAYVFDMKQGNRNLISEIMGKGYDATAFPSMYADIYCNYPDVRGFESIEIHQKDLFKGKILTQNGSVTKSANISGDIEKYVTFKSQSTDAVRFVNLLLSGKSSGPSVSEKGDVWMLRKNVTGVGRASDYVIKTADLSKIENLVDNVDLGLKGCYIEGKYITELPKEAAKLVEPIIQFNTTRTAQTGGVLWWALDDYLGFASMADYDGSTTLRTGANVVLANNAAPSATILTAIRNQKLGLVQIQSAAALTSANFGTSNSSAPTAGTLQDVALNGQYNVNSSLFTANYEETKTIYARGNYWTGNIPAGSKILFKSDADGTKAFIGGFQPTNGAKTAFADRTMMFSTMLKGGTGFSGKPIQSLTIGQQMSLRSHYQKLLPIMATGIYAGAAGILDDQNDPALDLSVSGSDFTATLAEPVGGPTESGIEYMSVYKWNGTRYSLLETNSTGTYAFTANPAYDHIYKIEGSDYAGNKVSKIYYYSGQDAAFEDSGFDVKFDIDGGTRIGGGALSQPVVGGNSAIAPIVNRTGYTFLGWDKSFEEITQDVTIKALWSPNSY
ncbi:MAG: hypothetical protein ACRCUS_07220, partial [Anaerovoracaceae bacterium]